MAKDWTKVPLTPAQRETARNPKYGWYRRWLLENGRTEAEINGEQPTK
jgi:hypothetical protein